MSLSTEEAINSAISDLENAERCLMDALIDVNLQQEIEQTASTRHHLESKLEMYQKTIKLLTKHK